jgi:aryl-alcohol dehydrogenase-like predicted oxidoreductase
MKTRKLGKLAVSALGLGCISMSRLYGRAFVLLNQILR